LNIKEAEVRVEVSINTKGLKSIPKYETEDEKPFEKKTEHRW